MNIYIYESWVIIRHYSIQMHLVCIQLSVWRIVLDWMSNSSNKKWSSKRWKPLKFEHGYQPKRTIVGTCREEKSYSSFFQMTITWPFRSHRWRSLKPWNYHLEEPGLMTIIFAYPFKPISFGFVFVVHFHYLTSPPLEAESLHLLAGEVKIKKLMIKSKVEMITTPKGFGSRQWIYDFLQIFEGIYEDVWNFVCFRSFYFGEFLGTQKDIYVIVKYTYTI